MASRRVVIIPPIVSIGDACFTFSHFFPVPCDFGSPEGATPGSRGRAKACKRIHLSQMREARIGYSHSLRYVSRIGRKTLPARLVSLPRPVGGHRQGGNASHDLPEEPPGQMAPGQQHQPVPPPARLCGAGCEAAAPPRVPGNRPPAVTCQCRPGGLTGYPVSPPLVDNLPHITLAEAPRIIAHGSYHERVRGPVRSQSRFD